MPWFEYEGLTPGGTAIAGRIEAMDPDRARADLYHMQIEVREVRPAAGPPRSPAPLTEEDFIFFNEQLASLAEAGIALDEGLAQLARDVHSDKLRRWITDVVHDLRRGVPIDQAIAIRERGLPILYSRVIKAGIASGQLPATLLNLNNHLRLTGTTRRMLWEIVSYPLLVGVLALTVMSLFLIFAVPQFEGIFQDFGTSLPALTRLLLGVAHCYPFLLAGFIGFFVVVILIWHLLRMTPGGIALRERIVLGLPLIGRVHRASLIARFLRSAATAVASGVPLPQAIRLSADTTGSRILSEDAEYLATEAEHGRSIFSANQTTRIIPPLFGYCVQVALGREALPTSIAKLARSYENRAYHSQALLRVLLFPLLVILLGGMLVVGITGLFLPLVSLINSVSGGF